MSTVVVYVHGLWQRGAESLWLRRRLARDVRAQSRTFSYPSVAGDADANARALVKSLCAIEADALHLVGHSLGGLVIFKAFAEQGAGPLLPPGRIVMLGSPLGGSRAARNLDKLPFGRQIMGQGVSQELLETRERRRWNGARELGIIAGNLGVGVGRLTGLLGGPSDGTILIEETRLEGATDHVVLRVSHTGMLFSAAVARAAGVFLNTGRFAG